MQDHEKTQDQLIDELNEMRRKVAALEAVQKSWNKNEGPHSEIIDRSSEAIFIIQGGWINYANEKTSEITGYPKEKLLNSSAIVTFVHPDDREMVAQYHAGRLKGDETPYRYPFRIVSKDGYVRWVETNSSLIMWEGKPAVLCLMSDITDRKRAEEALLKSERFLSNIFKSIPDGISVLDKDMNIIMTNQTMERWYPHALPFTGKKCFEAYHCASQPCVECPVIHTFKTGKSAVEVVPMTGEGGIRIGWNELYSFPLTDSVTGEITGVIEFVRDVTERRNMEEALLRSEDKFSTAFHKSPIIMSISDVDDGSLIDVNDKFCEVSGFSRNECIGKTAVELGLLSAEVRILLREKLLANGSISGEELKLLTKDKKEIYCVYNADLIQTKTRQLILAVAQDITYRKRMEKELKDSEVRCRRISSLTSDIAYSCQKPDAAPYSIDWMIGATERILGYSVDDIKALKCWRNLVVDEDLSIFDSNVTGVSPGTSAFCELRLRHKDGSIIWVSSYVECVLEPGSPDNLHLYGGLVDITKRKIIEKELVESEKKYRLITETIKDCFWMATPNIDRILHVSPAYETIWGRSCQSLYESPRSFMDAMHPDDRNRAVNILEEHRSRMAGCTITYRIIRPDGAIRWIEDRSFPVLDENGNLYMNVGVA